MNDGVSELEKLVAELAASWNKSESLHQLLPEGEQESKSSGAPDSLTLANTRQEVGQVIASIAPAPPAKAPSATGHESPQAVRSSDELSDLAGLILGTAVPAAKGALQLDSEGPALPRRPSSKSEPSPKIEPAPVAVDLVPLSQTVNSANVLKAATTAASTAPGSAAVELLNTLLPMGGSAGLAPSIVQSAASGVGVGSILTNVLTSGLGMVPLVRSIFSLFGGGGEKELPPLAQFTMPPAIQVARAMNGRTGEMSELRYSDSGLPTAALAEQANGGASGPTTINVNVSAMDSRSFLEHSNDIARAVREAMLNMHSINDVVSEL